MKYSEAQMGRIFVIRLEDGEILHEEIERFAREKHILSAMLIAVGAAGKGSKVVSGPEDGNVFPVKILEQVLDEAHEITGVGTIFPADDGQPSLHMHLSFGRKDNTITGCVRPGVSTWQIIEIILIELYGTPAARIPDSKIGFNLLEPEGDPTKKFP